MPLLTPSRRSLLTLAGAALLPAPAVRAQRAFPNRPIRLVVAFAPGGNSDTLARLITPKMAAVLGQNIVVDNRGGAGGTLAAGAVASAAADGHTLLFDAASFVVAQFVQRSTPFNYERDFAPVGNVADVPYILAVPANAGVRDLKGFLDKARADREGTSYGTPGVGSPGHLAGALLAHRAGVKLEHIPYRGGSEVARDLAAGTLPAGILTANSLNPVVQGGRAVPIAVTSAQARRHPRRADHRRVRRPRLRHHQLERDLLPQRHAGGRAAPAGGGDRCRDLRPRGAGPLRRHRRGGDGRRARQARRAAGARAGAHPAARPRHRDQPGLTFRSRRGQQASGLGRHLGPSRMATARASATRADSPLPAKRGLRFRRESKPNMADDAKLPHRAQGRRPAPAALDRPGELQPGLPDARHAPAAEASGQAGMAAHPGLLGGEGRIPGDRPDGCGVPVSVRVLEFKAEGAALGLPPGPKLGPGPRRE